MAWLQQCDECERTTVKADGPGSVAAGWFVVQRGPMSGSAAVYLCGPGCLTRYATRQATLARPYAAARA